MALEIAMDEMAEQLGMDPVEFRVLNDTQVVPDHAPEPSGDDPQAQQGAQPESGAGHPFTQRSLVQCLRTGAERFGWSRRNPRPAQVREEQWLIGQGVAAAYRGNQLTTSGGRVRLERNGRITVETDMTDIGTGSYTILAQTAAEMLGVAVDQVDVILGDSSYPVSAGS